MLAVMRLTPAQERMLALLDSATTHELRRRPDSGGWVEWWHVVDDWGRHVPLGLVANAATRCWRVLERLGLIESHPEHDELVRRKQS